METMEEYKEYISEMSLKEQAQQFVDLKAQIDELSKVKAELQKKFDFVRKSAMPEKMENEGYDNIKLTGIGRISLRAEIYAGIVTGKKNEAEDWLRNNGHADLIVEMVNASTLKAFTKEQIRNGEPLPEDLFKAEPYMMATITKS
jgi:hypothetical protein